MPLTKLSANGDRILWSTYFGRSKSNSDRYEAGSLAVDESGRIWLTEMTSSPDLPTRNAFQKSCEGGDFDGSSLRPFRRTVRDFVTVPTSEGMHTTFWRDSLLVTEKSTPQVFLYPRTYRRKVHKSSGAMVVDLTKHSSLAWMRPPTCVPLNAKPRSRSTS